MWTLAVSDFISVVRGEDLLDSLEQEDLERGDVQPVVIGDLGEPA
jgi:hypothetical protein